MLVKLTINNKNILIDADHKSDDNYIVEFLKEKNLDTIDYFIITHGDMYNRGGVEIVLDNCNVGQIFMLKGIKEVEDDYQDLKKIVNRFHVDDAIICYFACRIVGKEILLKIDKARESETYEIDWNKYNRDFNRF